MIKIFYCDSDIKSISAEISEHRRTKINAAKVSPRQQINAALTLKAGFASYGINEKDVIYGAKGNGKPFAVNYPNIRFSLAHSGDMAIAAFSDREIGIDLEKSDRVIPSEIISRFFSSSEAESFSGNTLLLWCAKEAAVKYSGKGFAKGRSDYSVPFFVDEALLNGIWLKKIYIDGYECIVCAGNRDEIEINKL